MFLKCFLALNAFFCCFFEQYCLDNNKSIIKTITFFHENCCFSWEMLHKSFKIFDLCKKRYVSLFVTGCIVTCVFFHCYCKEILF